MRNITAANIEWDSLLLPDDLSSEEKEEHSALISEYLSRTKERSSMDSTSINDVTDIKVDDSLLETEEVELEKISNQKLFDYFQNEKVDVRPDILFPKTDNPHALFWVLHNLGEKEIKRTKIAISNPEEVSAVFYYIVEAASFFGFFNRFIEEDTFYFAPTEQYEEFMDLPLEEQYHQFLASLGRNETISEILQVQLNDPLYDNISRQMVHNILVKDPNIKEEELTNDEVKKIINNFRYWYLAIKKTVLDN